MTTAAQVIKKFMVALDSTELSGEAALDEAVKACADGDFSSIREVIQRCVNDCQETSDGTLFLQNSCDINLSNSDTGAISGLDAGGSTAKTAESIVPESGTAETPTGPTSSFSGLTVTWPTGVLTTKERVIADYLNTWWIPQSLQLISDSYGLSFEEAGSRMNNIKIATTKKSKAGQSKQK